MKIKPPENPIDLPVGDIKDQMLEMRPLPMGAEEFELWSDRIISGALVTADIASLKFALANMLLHLGPTESHKPDAYFIHSLRKTAINQVALAMIDKIKKGQQEKLAAEKEKNNSEDPQTA